MRFKKLLSNLPFNPSLADQVSFYAKRLRREEKTRQLGAIVLGLAVLVQLFAVISPPEPTLARSANDILEGGFQSQEEALQHCQDNSQGFATILSYYQIDCDMLRTATKLQIKSTDKIEGQQLQSMGRISLGPVVARTNKTTNEYSVSVGAETYFMRNLSAWDSGSHSTYDVLSLENKNGVRIMIMFNCGNVITAGPYEPPAPESPSEPEESAPPESTTPEEPEQEDQEEPLEDKDACPNKPGTQASGSECDVCPSVAGTQYTLNECDVCPNVPDTQSKTSECYPCPEANNTDDGAVCLEMDKTAANQTKNLGDADGSLADANDIIVYTLSATNKGNQTIPDFQFEENLSDVLQYADIVNPNEGSLDESATIRWPETDIAAGATATRNVTVRVKDPIPNTPVSASDPAAFDLMMTNSFYGNSVNIELPQSTIKRTEFVARTLPKTGSGTTVVSSAIMVMVVSYFLARSRLLAEELAIVRDEYITSGGQ